MTYTKLVDVVKAGNLFNALGTESVIESDFLSALHRWGLRPELQVVIGCYRADFVVDKVVIECDGKEFHQDKEREQKRDKYLNEAGYTVVHFSGSDIYNNPDKCVYDLIYSLFPSLTQTDMFKAYAKRIDDAAYEETQLLILKEEIAELEDSQL